MLFDLRGRRRRLIQTIYLGLAILLGGGLVLFGIGGEVSGGLVDAVRGNGGGGDSRIEQQEEQAVERTRANPRDAAAWAALARARYQVAGQGENYDQNTGTFTEDGRARLRSADQAWQRYLELEPEEPDDRVASLMVQAYGPAGLNDAENAVTAQEIVAEARPSSGAYATLAIFAYQANQTRKGDLARREAIDRAPEDQRDTVREQLDQAKAGGGAPPGAEGAGGGAAGGGEPVPPPPAGD
jgi:hypothetical protein